MNKFMRLMVFFDLPVVKDKDRKAAAKFRRFLLKDGYVMVQWSGNSCDMREEGLPS